MRFTVYGILAATGTNTELGSYRSFKQAAKSLENNNRELYPVMVITKAERKGTGLLDLTAYYWQNDQLLPWFVTCLIWQGHKLGYDPYTFDPLHKEEHGRQFWEQPSRQNTIRRVFNLPPIGCQKTFVVSPRINDIANVQCGKDYVSNGKQWRYLCEDCKPKEIQ